jgi:hypothetical protein
MEGRQEHYERIGVTYTLQAIPFDDGFLALWSCPQCGESWESPTPDTTSLAAVEHARADADNHHDFKHRGLKRRRP